MIDAKAIKMRMELAACGTLPGQAYEQRTAIGEIAEELARVTAEAKKSTDSAHDRLNAVAVWAGNLVKAIDSNMGKLDARLDELWAYVRTMRDEQRRVDDVAAKCKLRLDAMDAEDDDEPDEDGAEGAPLAWDVNGPCGCAASWGLIKLEKPVDDVTHIGCCSKCKKIWARVPGWD
jgi:outer membrane murein-binding lipoprotein Lpp